MANADDLRRLAEEVKSAYEERVKCITDVKKQTAGLLRGFDKAHKEMAKELRAELAKVKPDLESAESERKKADQAEIAERGVYIEKLLDDFDSAHQEMADNLRSELARVKPDLESAESERKKADQSEISERKEAVRSMLDEFRKEHEETAAAWQKLLAAMQSARGPAVKAAVKVKSVKEVIEEPAEEAVEEAEQETKEDREELKENIIEVLEDNPDGKKMAEIAEILGIENWRSLIPVMRELLDADEIRKEDSTYYVS